MGNPQNARAGDELHAAARSGDLNTVQGILSTNPLAVNSRDKHSRTPLHLAAWSGQAEVVNCLCKNKADVGAAAMDDMGAIHFAAQKGHLDVVRALLSSGASVKATTRKGMTPLHFAAQGSNLELVKYLVKKGASLSAKTRAGKTPLDLASNEEVRSFLEEQERPTKNGESSNKEKAEECETKASTLGPEDNPDAESLLPAVDEEDNDREKRKDAESLPPAVDEEDNDREKRKGDEDDVREASPQPKKARIKLSHLQSSDDTQEEDEQ